MGIKLAVYIIAIVYSIASIIAGAAGIKQKKVKSWLGILMIFGGALLASSFLGVLGGSGIYIMILGLIFIHISAIGNGLKMYGRINPKHHAVRLCISLFLVLCRYFYL